MEECIFCKIVRNDVPSFKIYEDEYTVAFLDINPASLGHVLVAPKKHVENVFDADEETIKNVYTTVKKISEIIKHRLQPHGVNILQNNGRQAGQIVAHFHVHIIPRYENDQIVFAFPRKQVNESQMKELVEKLKYQEEKKEDEFDFNLE